MALSRACRQVAGTGSGTVFVDRHLMTLHQSGVGICQYCAHYEARLGPFKRQSVHANEFIMSTLSIAWLAGACLEQRRAQRTDRLR